MGGTNALDLLCVQQQERSRLGPDSRAAAEGDVLAEAQPQPAATTDRPREDPYDGHDYRDDRPRASGERSGAARTMTADGIIEPPTAHAITNHALQTRTPVPDNRLDALAPTRIRQGKK